MNKNKLRIIVDILIILIGVVFLIFGVKDGVKEINKHKVTDGEKFHRSFSYVSAEESVYEYVSIRGVYSVLDEDSVVLFGDKNNAWTQVLVKPLNDIYKNDKIYYVEMNDIDLESPAYEGILSKLKIKKLIIPTVVITKNNKYKIISRDDIVDKDYVGAPIDYFTKSKVNKLKELVK